MQWANHPDTSETASRKVILGKGLTTNTKAHPKQKERENDKIRKSVFFFFVCVCGPNSKGKKRRASMTNCEMTRVEILVFQEK